MRVESNEQFFDVAVKEIGLEEHRAYLVTQSQVGYGKDFTHGNLVQFAFIDSEGFFETDVEWISDWFAVLGQLNENLWANFLNNFLGNGHAVVSFGH